MSLSVRIIRTGLSRFIRALFLVALSVMVRDF
jgi:hypothetical protein